MNNENNFIENCFNHTLHVYIDIAGDLVAGTLLSQIMYWFSSDKNGDTKLRVKKKDGMWLAKSRTDWYEEIRISPKQYDRAIKVLKSKGLVETKLYRFNGCPTNHIRPIVEKIQALSEQWQKERAANIENITIFPKGKNPISPKGKIQFDERVKTLTENTTETTNKDYTHKGHFTDKMQGGGEKVPFKSFVWNNLEQYQKYLNVGLRNDITDIIAGMNKRQSDFDECYSVMRYFFDKYEHEREELHPMIQKTRLSEIIELFYSFDELGDEYGGLNVDEIKECIDRFFKTGKRRIYSIYGFTESSTFKGILGGMYGISDYFDEINDKRGVGFR